MKTEIYFIFPVCLKKKKIELDEFKYKHIFRFFIPVAKQPQHSLTKNQSIRRTINHGHEKKNTEKGNVIFQQQDEKDTIELPSQLSYSNEKK